MTCSEIREALSAWYDGEDAAVEPAVVRAHVAGCRECAAYELAVAGLDERARGVAARTTAAYERTPDLAARVVPRARRRPAGLLLRLGVGLAGLGELATTAYLFLAGHDHDGHAGNEAVSLTVALCVALLAAAARPRLAAGYLPVLGVATLLMVVASAHDIVSGMVSVDHELQHLGLVVGFLLLCLLVLHERSGPTPGLLRRRPRRPVVRPALRAVNRALAPVARVWLHRWVRVLGGGLLAAALVLVGGPASAHAVLEGTTPAPDAVLTTAPTRVVLRFDEPVTLLPASLQVLGPDGKRVDDGAVGHADGDPKTASVAVTADERGTYLVSWRVVSADSHPVAGAFDFSVGARSVAPTAPAPGNSDRGMGVALGAARWLGYAGSALLVGGLLFLLVCRPASAERARPVLVGGAAVLALAAVGSLLLKGPDDAALGVSHLFDGALLREVVGTTYGGATIARLALALLALVALLVRGLPTSGLGGVAAGVLAAGVALTFALSGHAVSGSGSAVAIASESVHVLAMSAWLGGLVLLAAMVLRERGDASVAVAKRFSALALGAVVALAVTGVFQGWRQTRSWGALQDTTYGRELLVKLVLVVAVLTVAASSRAWLWRRPDLGRLRRTVATEALGIGVVLGVTSALVATQPASAAYHPSVSTKLTILGDTVQVSAVPAGGRTMMLHLYVFGRDRRLSEPAELTAAVSKGTLGPLAVDLTEAGPGQRQGTVSVPVTGDWQLTITLRTTAVDEDTAQVTLPIR